MDKKTTKRIRELTSLVDCFGEPLFKYINERYSQNEISCRITIPNCIDEKEGRLLKDQLNQAVEKVRQSCEAELRQRLQNIGLSALNVKPDGERE